MKNKQTLFSMKSVWSFGILTANEIKKRAKVNKQKNNLGFISSSIKSIRSSYGKEESRNRSFKTIS